MKIENDGLELVPGGKYVIIYYTHFFAYIKLVEYLYLISFYWVLLIVLVSVDIVPAI